MTTFVPMTSVSETYLQFPSDTYELYIDDIDYNSGWKIYVYLENSGIF